MGGLFGKKSQSVTPTRLNGIAINQSLYGNVVSLLYGTSRLPPSLIDYVDFKATPVKQASAGGKGGGGGSTTSSYTYSASIVMLLCEGTITGVRTVFSDQTQTTLSALGLVLFKGAGQQAPWSYMTTNHPDHALPYDHMAYVAGANFSLGGSAGLPNLAFEVQGLIPWQGGLDAEPSAILLDYCTDPNHGAGFPYLASLTGTNSYQAYCLGMDFLISPQETTQRQAQDFIAEILQLTNSNAVFTAGVGLRVVPYADQPVGLYTPDLTPQYRFGDLDYLYEEGQQPVVCTPVPANQTFNIWTVEYLNRDYQYNIDTESYRDEQDIAVNGERQAPTVTLHEITRASVALTVATLLCLRNLYVRSTYTFTVRADFSRLEPMDYIAFDDSESGIVDKLARVTECDDDENDVFKITCEEVLVGPASAPIYDTELAQGFAANYGADPGSVSAPYIFTAPPALAASGYEEWIAVTGVSGFWGGADIYASLDNVTYDHVGIKSNPSRYGTLTVALPAGNDPDTVNQLTVAFVGSVPVALDSATRAAADSLRNLCIVDGEIISYQNVTPMGNNTFRLSYLRRGNYGSTIAAHAIGSFFAVLDDAIWRMKFDPGLSGQPVWFKFVSFNYYGLGEQDISAVPSYQAFFEGQNNGQLLAPGATPLIARGDCVNVGQQIFKKTTASPAWDSDCRSVDAFAGGCTVRFRPMQMVGDFMIGLNSDPLSDESYVSLDHAWNPHTDGIAYIYRGGQLILPTRAFTTSDIFEIRYDGKFVTYFISGVQWYTTQDPGKTFFMDSSFFAPGAGADNVYFGALNPANPAPFLARGQCTVSDESAHKNGGVNGWDSDIYSLEGYPVAHVVWKCNQTNGYVFLGLGTKPGQDSSFSSVDFGWNCTPTGTAIPYVRGASAAASGIASQPYTTASVFAVIYDGSVVTWLLNNAVIFTLTDNRPASTTLGLTVFMDSSFYTPGAGVNTLQYGPTTALQLTDTTQIGQNAATETYGSSDNVATSGSIAAGGIRGGPSIIVLPVPAFACTAILTATFNACVTTSGAASGDVTAYGAYQVIGPGGQITNQTSATQVPIALNSSPTSHTVQWLFSHPDIPTPAATEAIVGVNLINNSSSSRAVITGFNVVRIEYIKR